MMPSFSTIEDARHLQILYYTSIQAFNSMLLVLR